MPTEGIGDGFWLSLEDLEEYQLEFSIPYNPA